MERRKEWGKESSKGEVMQKGRKKRMDEKRVSGKWRK